MSKQLTAEEALKKDLDGIIKWKWSLDGRKFNGNHKEVCRILIELAEEGLQNFSVLMEEYAASLPVQGMRGIEITELDKARFWSKVKDTGYCWEWQAGKSTHGYGMFKANGIYAAASRWAYQIIYGNIPDDLHVLHKCDNPGCVNPFHLFTGTHQDNMLDKAKKGRSRKIGRNNKYLGVCFRPESKRWRSYISQNGKMITLGHFATDIEAAKRRDEEIITRKMELPLNFPLPPTKK